MIANIPATFNAEAQELIEDLEKALLNLEQDNNNKESISAVFRSMHGLKASALLSGFESISTLTNNLEIIYKSIQDGKGKLTQAILIATFNSLDHLKILLDDSEMGNQELKNTHEILLKEVEMLLMENLKIMEPTDQIPDITKTEKRIEAQISLPPGWFIKPSFADKLIAAIKKILR